MMRHRLCGAPAIEGVAWCAPYADDGIELRWCHKSDNLGICGRPETTMDSREGVFS